MMKNLKNIRIKHGMTQDRLAVILGVEKSSISKWETTDVIPHIDKLLKISELFKVTYDELLREEQ
jgi:transcriptional regulator with XRE-family HTH domain